MSDNFIGMICKFTKISYNTSINVGVFVVSFSSIKADITTLGDYQLHELFNYMRNTYSWLIKKFSH